jgi:hypothetical protein
LAKGKSTFPPHARWLPPAIEPLLWTPLLFLRGRALFNDALAASLKADF